MVRLLLAFIVIAAIFVLSPVRAPISLSVPTPTESQVVETVAPLVAAGAAIALARNLEGEAAKLTGAPLPPPATVEIPPARPHAERR